MRDVSYDIRAGEILCIVGESGSGKSMSANAIMGLLPDYLTPQQGSILFRGADLLRQDEASLQAMRGKDMAMIFQEPLSALNPLMTVGEQISEVMRVHDAYPGPARLARALELLAFVGLPDPATLYHAYPFRLSGGQRQRVMIAMALALEPALLIADEPTTALDVTTQAQILALIARIQKEKGMGVMFVTHDFGVVAEIAHRVAVMEKACWSNRAGGPGAESSAPSLHPAPDRRRAASARRGTRGRWRRAAGAGRARPAQDLCDRPWLARRPARGARGGRRQLQRAARRDAGHRGRVRLGKSTIGKCLLKLVGINGGQLLFNGQDIAAMPESRFRPMRKDIQMIFQDPFASLNPRHTVGRIISDGPRANGVPQAAAEARARELLALVGLEPSAFDRYPNQFSGGQRQRVGIARGAGAWVLVADESVSALDVSVQAQVLELLRELQQRLRIALVFITHDLRVAAQICDAVLVMHRGKVVEHGTPSQIFDRPQHAYTKQLIAAVPGQHWDPTQARAQAA